MSEVIIAKSAILQSAARKNKNKRIESIDLLRGIVMIIMALDHVRDYFHQDAFHFEPEDLTQTSGLLFFTRFITHYCAPAFVFLAGTSAYLYGTKKSKKELSLFLLTRGFWLIFLELFIVVLFRSFNPAYHYINLQVIWAIGFCMTVLSALIYMKRSLILLTGALLIFGHNLLDNIHVAGNGTPSFIWALLHEAKYFHFGYFTIHVYYPVLPWLGIMMTGYYFGQLYIREYDSKKRKNTLLSIGSAAIALFIILRSGNFYGDSGHWSVQKNTAFSFLSFLNVTKYPPSLLYCLVTLGPSLVFLALAEKPLTSLTTKIAVYGRVPMFYYLAHILIIHILATIGAICTGFKLSDMILNQSVQSTPALRNGYGFNLLTVYMVWAGLVLMLYPFCKWYDHYKRTHQSNQWWLSYL
jgi:uncharacterized membrane protein